MKFSLPLVCAALLTACSTPETRHVDHQARLREEARENFYRERDENRRQRGIVAPPSESQSSVAQNGSQPAPKLRPFRGLRPPTPPPAQPRTRRVIADDTIYEPTDAGRQEQRAWEMRQAQEYKAYEVREARKLGKRPDQLTREERLWIRESFQ